MNDYSSRSMTDLTNEVAVVTGGAAGIGLAIARRFAAAGAQVVVVDVNPDTKDILTSHELTSAYAVVADVAEPHNHAGIIARASQPFGTPTILVNNAGIYPWVALIDATPEFFDLLYNTNLRGLALMSIAFAKALVASGRDGSILNIASVEGLKPALRSGLAPYSATKGGVIALTRHMAVELAQHGISVNAIAPGTVLTEGAIEGLGGPDKDRSLAIDALQPHLARVPVVRVADPDDIAGVAQFLVSSAADYIRGQNHRCRRRMDTRLRSGQLGCRDTTVAQAVTTPSLRVDRRLARCPASRRRMRRRVNCTAAMQGCG